MNIFKYLKEKIKAFFYDPIDAEISERMGVINLQNNMMLKYRLKHCADNHQYNIIEYERKIEELKLCITVGNNALNVLEAAYQESDENTKKK